MYEKSPRRHRRVEGAAKAVDRAVELAASTGAALTDHRHGRDPTTGDRSSRVSSNATPTAGVPIDTLVVDHDPVAALVETATEGGYDVVVVGDRGMTGMTQFFRLGSVPNKVSHHLPCTLLIVRTT